MNDLRAIGGFAYFRSIIGIVLARLVYNTPLFVSQFDRCFIVRVEIISAAAATKVADALQLVAMFVAEDDAHPGGDYVVGALVV
jgi:hypothetical protein